MSNPEFSTQFDILYNNITSNQAPGLNEYEKSVFLTKAQRMLVEDYFNPKTDGAGGGYDGNQKRQYDFSSIVQNTELEIYGGDAVQIDKRSIRYLFPKDYFLSVNEVLYDDYEQYSVMPISYDEYQRLLLKPYSYPTKRGAWRLITGEGSFEKVIEDEKTVNTTIGRAYTRTDTPMSVWDFLDNGEVSLLKDQIFKIKLSTYSKVGHYALWNASKTNILRQSSDEDTGIVYTASADISGWIAISKSNDEHPGEGIVQYSITTPAVTVTLEGIIVEVIGKFKKTPEYTLRYVRIPSPIILADLTAYGDGISIDGKTSVTECELPEACHTEILDRAVALAKIAWQGGVAQAQN